MQGLAYRMRMQVVRNIMVANGKALAFWSPLTEVAFEIKITVGIIGWVILLGYLLFAGRGRAAH